MKNIPEKIYIQVGENVNTKQNIDFNGLVGITWAGERINQNDLVYKRISEKRTLAQNSAMWLFCTWISQMLNDVGEMYVNPLEIEIPWTKDLVMEIYWRPLQKQLYKKKSTTKLTTMEISPIAEAIIMHFAKKGYDLEFPNFQSFLNKLDAQKFD